MKIGGSLQSTIGFQAELNLMIESVRQLFRPRLIRGSANKSTGPGLDEASGFLGLKFLFVGQRHYVVKNYVGLLNRVCRDDCACD